MKLIVGGSTGFVATEVIRQALSDPSITSIVAIGRRSVTAPSPSADPTTTSKLTSVVVPDADWENYPAAVKTAIAGAGACIWTVAVTPDGLKTTPWETTVKTCRDYAIYALKTMAAATSEKPFRFVYMSGVNAVRDPAEKPLLLGDYCVLRGEAENLVLEYARTSGGAVEAAVAKPGVISGPGRETSFLRGVFLHGIVRLPKIRVDEIAAAMLHAVLSGFEDDTLSNPDMVRIGQGVLKKAT
ncbi:hypothetical protein B0H66DRAFT_218375 [Apodospora peruviana]|uniref:NAD(P)-binding domain-containing protein n=1 Tax=Apodospora peruviana TaxID=516989 RepID=A0AAE0IEX4_9PEZI|nr:hypothetical protein B0H66DRAFT_218375 [Apodospora peruviana]